MNLQYFYYCIYRKNIFVKNLWNATLKKESIQSGITTIEIMVVFAIMAIFFSLATTRYVIDDTQRLEYEGAFLISELRYLQRLAMMQEYKHNDFMNIDGKYLPIMKIDKKQGYYILVNNKRIHAYTLPKGFTMSINRKNIMFFRDGNAQATTISLEFAGVIRYIIIDVAGRIRMSKTPPVY